MDKEKLRQKLQEELVKISAEDREAKSRKACKNLISTEEFDKSSAIMIFLSLPHEIDTTDAILHAWQRDKVVVVPKVSWEQRHMIPVRINTLDDGISTTGYGLRNPISGIPFPFEEIDLVVTPGLGFDRKGNRLGRGASYYDRFFTDDKLKAPKCGFAFDGQIVDSVPMSNHDIPVDFLVTDEEILRFQDDTFKDIGQVYDRLDM
jgi:5-formyltetrahydrofolate cyclo-ligase